jgi:hypothetical protein
MHWRLPIDQSVIEPILRKLRTAHKRAPDEVTSRDDPRKSTNVSVSVMQTFQGPYGISDSL